VENLVRVSPGSVALGFGEFPVDMFEGPEFWTPVFSLSRENSLRW